MLKFWRWLWRKSPQPPDFAQREESQLERRKRKSYDQITGISNQPAALPLHQCPYCGGFPPYDGCYHWQNHPDCKLGPVLAVLQKAKDGTLTLEDMKQVPVGMRGQAVRQLIRQKLSWS